MRNLGGSRLLHCVSQTFVPLLIAVSGVSAEAEVFVHSVDAIVAGTGTGHPNFDDPSDVLGAPDYADPSGTGFGTGAYSLGVDGSVTLRMQGEFGGDGTSAPDLVIYEIGPSSGGSSEAVRVEVSTNGVVFSQTGSSPGGPGSIDLDFFGLGPGAGLRFVRLTDLTRNAGAPAGPDIDAVRAVNAVPVPGLDEIGRIVLLVVALAIGTMVSAGSRRVHG